MGKPEGSVEDHGLQRIVALDIIDPYHRLIAAVVYQAVRDLRITHRAVAESPKEGRFRDDAEAFFMTRRCLPWLAFVTPDDLRPELVRQKILQDERRRRQRVSPQHAEYVERVRYAPLPAPIDRISA